MTAHARTVEQEDLIANFESGHVLADRLDVSRQTINAIEKGKHDPSLPLAFKLARLFGLPIEELFTDEQGDTP